MSLLGVASRAAWFTAISLVLVLASAVAASGPATANPAHVGAILGGGTEQSVAFGLDWTTSRYERVSLDSYFVVVGDDSVLVHNDGLIRTPATHPEDFESVRGLRAVRNEATGEIWGARHAWS